MRIASHWPEVGGASPLAELTLNSIALGWRSAATTAPHATTRLVSSNLGAKLPLKPRRTHLQDVCTGGDACDAEKRTYPVQPTKGKGVSKAGRDPPVVERERVAQHHLRPEGHLVRGRVQVRVRERVRLRLRHRLRVSSG